jgi:hypothetical protein
MLSSNGFAMGKPQRLFENVSNFLMHIENAECFGNKNLPNTIDNSLVM